MSDPNRNPETADDPAPSAPSPRRPRLPREVWLLGWVSLFVDFSSEYIHSLLPVYLTSVLGASALAVGLLEGVAESFALFVKIFSGAVSDRWGRRKPLVLFGYSLAALTKPLFPLAQGIGWVVGARLLDRLGKGIRGAPRDALIADVTAPGMRGAAYGLRQSMDTVGAFVGPSIAIVVLLWFAHDLRSALWIASFPAAISVFLLVCFLREPEVAREHRSVRWPFRREALGALGGDYARVVAIGFLLTTARSAEAFLVLRVSEFLGRSGQAFVPIAILTMSLSFTLTAYPVGHWSDRVPRGRFLVASFLALALADGLLAFAPGLWVALLGVLVWGVHMGLGQGVVSALVSDVVPAKARGTAFGLLHGVSAVGLLAASAWNGWFYDRQGASTAFLLQAALALAGAIGTIVVLRSFRTRDPAATQNR